MLTDQDLSTMSLAELKMYLKTLKKDVFPGHPKRTSAPKSQVVQQIHALTVVADTTKAMGAVKVARKTMNRPIEIETVPLDETNSIAAPIAPVTYEPPKKRAPKKATPAPPVVSFETQLSPVRGPNEPRPRPQVYVEPEATPAEPPSKFARYLKPL